MQPSELASKIRRYCLQMTHDAKASHIGSCLSCADILAVLYGSVMNYSTSLPTWHERDRFILGKGHACAALYATLAECGFFPVSELSEFYQGNLMGHASHEVAGVDVSTGSLGMGLSVGCGMAMASSQRVFVLLGDGDCQEGMTWEAALFAAQHKLDNLIVIIDYNKLQALGKEFGVLSLSPLADKWSSFGWAVKETDGHSVEKLERVLRLKFQGHPYCIIAHTTKGQGVSFMENKLAWHYKYPNDEELKKALEEIK